MARSCLQSHEDSLGLMWSAMLYVQSLAVPLCILLYCFCGACSCCVAGAVVNSDGSDSRAAISCCLIKE